LPVNSKLNARVGTQGTRVFIKKNHLLNVDAQIDRVSAVM